MFNSWLTKRIFRRSQLLIWNQNWHFLCFPYHNKPVLMPNYQLSPTKYHYRVLCIERLMFSSEMKNHWKNPLCCGAAATAAHITQSSNVLAHIKWTLLVQLLLRRPPRTVHTRTHSNHRTVQQLLASLALRLLWRPNKLAVAVACSAEEENKFHLLPWQAFKMC